MKTKPLNIARQRQANTKGFTIVELMIATVVFSLVLIVFLSAIIRVGQLFYKGVNMSNTQEAGRNVLESISNDLQFSSEGPVIPNNTQGYFCIGDHRYSYRLGYQLGSTSGAQDYGILRETMSTCKSLSGSAFSQAPDKTKGSELLSPDMQVNKITLTPQPNQGLRIQLHIVFYGGDKRVFTTALPGFNTDLNDSGYNADQAPDALCTGAQSGSQFCATADYNSVILQKF